MTEGAVPVPSWLLPWLAVWLGLAVVWLAALPRQTSRAIDRAYPLLPLLVGGACMAFGPAWPPTWLALVLNWLQLGWWLWLMLTATWLVSLLKRDSSIMDIAYGFLMLGAPCWLWHQLGQDASARSWLVLALATLGFGRYGLYICWRNLPHGEDPRYARWRARFGGRWAWWSYFQVFLLQGVVLWIWAVPMVLTLLAPGALGGLHIAATAVWLVGLVFEAGGDWQLTRFKKQRHSRDQLLETGLWAWSRHPNYFGQTCMWWGYGLLALAHPLGWLALAPMAYVTWFMNRGSATSLMERHMLKTKPGYADYCARVPAFFPKPPALQRKADKS